MLDKKHISKLIQKIKLVEKKPLPDGMVSLTFQIPKELINILSAKYGDKWEEILDKEFIYLLDNKEKGIYSKEYDKFIGLTD